MLDNETTCDLAATDSHDLQSLSLDASDISYKWMPSNQNRQPVDDIDTSLFIVPKEKLATLKLLGKDEECQLASALANAAQAIARLTLIWQPSAQELLTLINSATTDTLKKRLFSDEAYYFSLRRELDDLINGEGNADILPLLLEEARLRNMSSNGEPSPLLTDYISQVDWPGPLMIAFARRYGNKRAPASTLERAIDEYLLNKKIAVSKNNYPAKQHRNQLDKHFNNYLGARETLVNHNFRLVLHIAKRYSQQSDHLADLIQEGMCGLIRAAEKFRPASGNRFSTYAHQWIKSKIGAARINVDKVVPISSDYNHDLRRISKWIEDQRSAQSPVMMSKLPEELNISKERLEAIMRLKQQPLSLDQIIDDNDGLMLHAKIADPESDFIEKCFNESNAQYLNGVIEDALSEREAYIINERFGRLNSDPKTLQQVSSILGLSCERIRQLEMGALKKLKRWLDRETV